MKRPHIINRQDLNGFVVSQVVASDSGVKRLEAVWEVITDTRYFELKLWKVDRLVTEKKYADLDEAIAAYNAI